MVDGPYAKARRDLLRDRLQRGQVLFADGGIGTALMEQGFRLGDCPELWNRDRPDAVRDVHAAFVAVGSELVTTNSFGGHPLRLALHGLDTADDVDELNRAAARLARDAAGAERFVIGSLGPCGQVLAPLGTADPDEVGAGYERQARALLAGGADLLLIETQSAVDEMREAVAAARRAGAELVGVSWAFDLTRKGEVRTMMGLDVSTAAVAARDVGADLLGANCGRSLGPAEMVPVVRALREAVDLPLLIEPNAGEPDTITGAHPRSPESFAAAVPELVAAGAVILGGCCGTTPAHLAAMRAALGGTS